MIGETISRYEIQSKIGDGGKGVVYKAWDPKLERFAALKFLPSHFAAQADERARFVREAKAASALDHPNICTIYEIDHTRDGQLFIAMAYYEGETLAQKIARGPMAVPRIVEIALQLATGLEKAHGQGIVHRDIKPSNIMITGDGVAKILDFGVAKLRGQTQLTGSGSTIGTLSYMSPEQVLGEEVDSRTDIWSLGVVLYEMLTGQLPFKGDYDQIVVYAIRNDHPKPVTSLRTGIPFELEWLVNKCLEKEAGYRYQSARDLRTDLRRVERNLASDRKLPVPAPKRAQERGVTLTRRRALAALFSLVALAGLSAYLLYDRLTGIGSATNLELGLTAFTGVDGLAANPTWSPDGNWIAYSSDEAGTMDIWKSPARGGTAQQLTSGPDIDAEAAWSPDGRIIAYSSRGERNGIFLIPADGGTPWQVCRFGFNPAWSPDNETIAFDWQGNIYIVSKNGGEPRAIVSGTSSTPYAAWTPDGDRLIYWDRTRGDVYVTSIEAGTPRSLGLIPAGQEVSGLCVSSDGKRLVYCQGVFGGDKDLWIVAFDLESGRTVGVPRPMLLTPTQDVQCSFSPGDDRIAFAARQVSRQLYTMGLDPATGLPTGGMRRMTMHGQINYYPALSPDGRLLLWTSHQAGEGSLYYSTLVDWKEQKATREWASSVREIGGTFSRLGGEICYSSTVGDNYEIWCVQSLGGIALQHTECGQSSRDVFPACSPVDGRIAFYSNRSGNWDIWCIDTLGETRQLTTWPSNEYYPAWSPDGRSIAFATDRPGHNDIWLMDCLGGDLRPLVEAPSEEGWSAWSPDGRRFYFVSDRNGALNIWMTDTLGSPARQVTPFRGNDFSLPDAMLFTKFAVSSSQLILPMEVRKGNIYILEVGDRAS